MGFAIPQTVAQTILAQLPMVDVRSLIRTRMQMMMAMALIIAMNVVPICAVLRHLRVVLHPIETVTVLPMTKTVALIPVDLHGIVVVLKGKTAQTQLTLA